jgi:hypothetical protein
VEGFSVSGSRGFFHPVANVSFEQGVEMIAHALKHARSLGLTDVVVNTLEMTGFAPPKVFGRYALATKIVESAGASLRVALVARPEYIDPQKIGVVMVQNRGGSGDIFATEREALKWLDGQNASDNQLPGRSQGVRPTD